MKYVKVPEAVVLTGYNGEKGETIQFRDFLQRSLLNDQKFGSSYELLRAARKIEEALAQANGYLQLEDADWQVLREIAQTPTAGNYQTSTVVARQLVPFLDAIVQAGDRKPE